MRKLSAGVIAAAMALTGVLLMPPGVPSAQATVLPEVIAPGAYSLGNIATGSNLHVSGVSIKAGATIVQETPRTTAGMSWWVGQTAPGVYQLRNNNSGLCLQDGAAAGAALTQENCDGTSAQKWRMAADDTGYTLVNAASGRAADVSAGATSVVSSAASAASSQRWSLTDNKITRVTAWGTALTDGGPALNDQTVRMVVRANVAGNAQRITLSNRFGTAPLVVGSATAAYQGSGLTASSTPSAFKFDGQATVTIPVGSEVVSDALNLPVKTDTNLLISVFVQGAVPVSTFHNLGLVSNGIATGNHAAETADAGFSQASSNYFFLKGIDVISVTAKGSMVALGDSITDGYGSTTNGFTDWPAQLANKINARDSAVAMVNTGIASNRVTFDAGSAKSRGMAATTRFAYDVATVPGINSVFFFEGINDIPDGATAATLIAGYRNIIAQARAAGLKIYGATMTPTKGVASFTAARELVRTTVNDWVLSSGEFDGVADFSAAVADPADPQKVLASYDSGDHIHLNATGYERLAQAVDVAPFTQPFRPSASGPGESIAAGGTALLAGSNFAAGEEVAVSGDCLSEPTTGHANSAGNFAAAASISASCPTGHTTVTLTGMLSKVPVVVTLEITAATTAPATTEPATTEPTAGPTDNPSEPPIDDSAIAPGAYSLTNAQTAKRLHVSGVSIAAGSAIVQEASRTTAGQSWWIAQTSPGTYVVRNNNSGLCLQDAAAAGGVLTQEDCASVASQSWKIAADQDGYTLVNAESGRAAEIAGAAAANVVSSPLGTTKSQRWMLSTNNITRVSVWGTGLTSAGPALNNQTVRMVVRPNLSGNAQRLTLSNRFGTTPLVVGAVTVQRQSSGLAATAVPQSVKFRGDTTVTIPAGAEVVSDALNVPMTQGVNQVVSVYVPGTVAASTFHATALVSNGIAAGDQSGAQAATNFTEASSSFLFLKSIDAISNTATGTMVALGDSLTNGVGSSIDGFNSWPAQLAGRITSRDAAMAMVNMGVDSNRVAYDYVDSARGMSAVTRFSHDVAALPGVTSVFLFEGINDVGNGDTAATIIAGYQNIIAQARAAGLKIYGATMTPFNGAAYYTAEREQVRETVNAWILASGSFDAVADFAAGVANPTNASMLLSTYDSGDHLHLNAAGLSILAHLADVAPFTSTSLSAVGGPAGAVEAGSSALVVGSGFARGEVVTVTGPCLMNPVTVTTSASGSFAASLPIAQECSAGTLTFTANGKVSGLAISVAIAVTAVVAEPTSTVSAPATASPVPSEAPTASPAPSIDATATSTATATPTPTATATATSTPMPSATASAPATASPVPSEAPTASPAPSDPATGEATQGQTTDPTVSPTSWSSPASQAVTANATNPAATTNPVTVAGAVVGGPSSTVQAATAADKSPDLASTGASAQTPLLLGGVLLLLGAVMVLRKRGRRV